MPKQKIPAIPSIRRLPSYLHIIRQAANEGHEFISGTLIAQELKLEPIQVRKDLSITGIIGKPKRGYPTKALFAAIERFLGWDNIQKAVLVGVGNLGSALIGYQEFKNHGLHVIAAFDHDEKKIGTKVYNVTIHSIASINKILSENNIQTAILTVPSDSAQETADTLISAGITAIWNFTNIKLKVPESVVVEREDLSSGYALLCVMMNANRTNQKDV